MYNHPKQQNENFTINLLSKEEVVSEIVSTKIIRQNGKALTSAAGEQLVNNAIIQLPLPYNYVEITCDDCILLDFILKNYGIKAVAPITYTENGLEATFSDGKNYIYVVRENRSYAMENRI